jgi:hypothetical protein
VARGSSMTTTIKVSTTAATGSATSQSPAAVNRTCAEAAWLSGKGHR